MHSHTLITAALLLGSLTCTVVAEDDVVVTRDVTYKVVGDRELRLDIARPTSGGPYPAILFIHGGGWQFGNRDVYLDDIETAARRGYVAATMTYRLTDPDENKVARAPFPAQIDDVKSAVRWMRRNARMHRIDPRRIGATGASAGGHLSLLIGVTGSDNDGSSVQAVVNYFGPTDMALLHRTSPKAGELAAILLGGSPETAAEGYTKSSPITHVTRSAPPTLTIHGDQDTLVPLEQATIFDQAMKDAGATHELLTITGAAHGFDGDNRAKAEAAMYEFFDRHLKK